MNVPLSLVRKLVDVPVSAQDLAELMNGRIAEVEHVIRFPARSAVADVRVGVFEELVAEQEGVQQWRVVAGESELLLAVQVRHDFEAGGRYAVVPAGGHTPGGDPVDARPMGPFDSQGMVLSEATLGIGDDATRPFAFAPEVPPDADVFEVLELDDAVLVFDLEPNRPDLFSLVGMARDLSAIFDTELRLPDSVSADWDPVPPDELRIDIQATERVHRYAALELSGVRVGPSPQWLQNAVRKLGMRPINNVVDAANLAMLELGQPLHTFDRHSLSTGVIGLRLARPGETITTLDGIERSLTDECLLVTDGDAPIALAGVMGDADSEIRTDTRDLLIESATFDMACVRRCSRRLALRTEASLRFEKGQPTCNVLPAMARLARILEQVGGAEVRVGRVADALVHPPPVRTLRFSPTHAARRLALVVDPETLHQRFMRLGIGVTPNGDEWLLELPEHRPDLAIHDDVNEEVGRLEGYERVVSAPPVAPLTPPRPNPLFTKGFAIRRALVGAGFDEVSLGAWLGDEDLELYGLPADRVVSLDNPIATNLVHFRSTALPDLVKAIVLNRKKLDEVRIFEVARVFFRRGDDLVERAHAAGAIAGARRAEGATRFYEARDALLLALATLGVEAELDGGADVPPWGLPHCFHPGRVVLACHGGDVVGVAGELHPALVARSDLQEAPSTFHLDLEALLDHVPTERPFVPPPRFPSVEYHVNVLAPDRLWARDLLDLVSGAGLAWLSRSAIRDIYAGEGVPSGSKRVTVELEFTHPARSLTHEEVLPQVKVLKTALTASDLVVEV